MRIEKISCTQFAGMQDRTVCFADGLNVLYGRNESGKSTMVDLIYQLLFHDVDARTGEKSAKDFRALYYPKNTDMQSNFADGTIEIGTEAGTYRLEKCWGNGAWARLTTPANTCIRSQKAIDRQLKAILCYGKGLYDDIVFAPQRRQEEMIRHIFQSVSSGKKAGAKEASGAKADLVAVIAQESIRNAGVDAGEYERRLNEIIGSYEGGWDVSKNLPKAASLRTKQAGKKPSAEGKLFQAYWKKTQLRHMLTAAQEAEKAVDLDMRELHAAEVHLAEAKDRKERFEICAAQLASHHANMQLAAELKEKISGLRQAERDYPHLLRRKAAAEKLRRELLEAETLQLYEDLSGKYRVWQQLKEALRHLPPVRKMDVLEAENLEHMISDLQRAKFNMDVLAQLQNMGNQHIEIRSLTGHRTIQTCPAGAADELRISEPVEIIIPGVMSLRLSSPVTGFHGEEPSSSLMEEYQHRLNEIYERCQIHSHSRRELHQLWQKYSDTKARAEKAEAVFQSALKNRNWETVQKAGEELSCRVIRRPQEAIREDIRLLCGEKDIEACCAELAASITIIEQNYGQKLTGVTPVTLRQAAAACLERLTKVTADIADAERIPTEFRRIHDVEGYRGTLRQEIADIEGNLAEIQARLQESQKYLQEKTAEEYAAELIEAEAAFDQTMEAYRHWLHIRAVFQSTRAAFGENNEMRDVEQRFGDYLEAITGGGVVLQSLSDNMDMEITSGRSKLNDAILSEGTKDTVALAFRLAMMEHIFPHGGGLLVLDDPFTDMDADRTEQACSLIRKYAARGNQVIFTTCDEQTAGKLGGNLVRFEETA